MLTLGTTLLLPAAASTRETAAQKQSQNNLKQMALAVHNVASNTTNGVIPPSYGVFPPGNPKGEAGFFTHLLPYIDQINLYKTWTDNATATDPVKTYNAPTDPNNPGTNALISYGSNATVFTVKGNPRLPNSFGGRTSGVIMIFERTAKSEATWSNDRSYLTETAEATVNGPGKTGPEFARAAHWTNYDKQATALTPAGCMVAMGDGSARTVTEANAAAGWAWAMNPNNANAQPSGW
jgi:hypothetical protein